MSDMGESIIDTIVDILKKDEYNAMILRPASGEDIQRCSADLEELALEPLPQGYMGFLQKSDGLSWNGIELYGTRQVMEVETGYRVMDIVVMNEEYNEEWEFDEKVLLGRDDEYFFTYNIETEKYETVERGAQEASKEFDSFEALFSDKVGGRLEALHAAGVKKNQDSESPKNLTWNDTDKIAQILRETHSGIAPVFLSREDIRKMVLKLEMFTDVETPDWFYLMAIQNRWIRLLHQGEGPPDPREVCP